MVDGANCPQAAVLSCYNEPSGSQGLCWEEYNTGDRAPFSSVLDMFEFIFLSFLTLVCCLLAAPGWVQVWPHSLPRHSSPQGLLFVGQQPPGFARPFPWRHWQSSSSGRGGNRHLALRQELKPAQPSSSLGEPRPALRPALSAQGRACDFLLGLPNPLGQAIQSAFLKLQFQILEVWRDIHSLPLQSNTHMHIGFIV